MGTRKLYTERPRSEPTAALLCNLLQIPPVEAGVVLNLTLFCFLFFFIISDIWHQRFCVSCVYLQLLKHLLNTLHEIILFGTIFIRSDATGKCVFHFKLVGKCTPHISAVGSARQV